MPRTKETKGRRLSRVMLTVLSAAIIAASVFIPAARAENPPMTVVYALDSANLTFRDSDAANINQINYAFALIRDGEAVGSHWAAIDRVRAYLRKHPHIRGVMAVGGWGAEGFSDACATADGRARLADSILRLMDENGFRGVDIDWEYPGTSAGGIKSRAEDVENWYALLTLLRDGLDKRTAATGQKHTLSVAVGAGDSLLKPIDPARLNALADQVVVMAYDLCGFDRETGHHAALYGRMWRQVSGSAVTQTAGISGTKVLNFPDLLALESQGYTRYYDGAAKAAYWVGGENFVSGEDEQSIRDKAQWAVQQGLQGAAVWSYGQDDSGKLLAWLKEALSQ